jgi:hypothetical protein
MFHDLQLANIFFGGIDTSVSVLCILSFRGGVRGWGFGFWWLQTSLHWIRKGPPSLLRNNILNALTGLSTITTSQDAHNFCRFSSSSGPVAHLHHILGENLTIPCWKTPTTKCQTQCDDLLRTIVYIHMYIYNGISYLYTYSPYFTILCLDHHCKRRQGTRNERQWNCCIPAP